VRNAERTDFTATVTDYSESIDAVAGAINVLKKRAQDAKQAALIQTSLIQVRSLKLVPVASKKALTAFLQQAPELDVAAPEANAYEFQSGGVVDMLEKLNDEFSNKKTELEKEELGAQQVFEQIMQQLADNIENAEFEISKKTKHRAQTQENKAEAEGDLAQTTADRNEDQKYLDDTSALCTQKTSDFESRQQLRADEIGAISKAIEIIGSQAVAGSGDKHLPALVQIQKKGSAFAQLRSNQQSPEMQKVVSFLNEQARKTGSRMLSEMALSAQANPFGKVKKMVKDLIVKLMEEAISETEHKGFCDTDDEQYISTLMSLDLGFASGAEYCRGSLLSAAKKAVRGALQWVCNQERTKIQWAGANIGLPIVLLACACIAGAGFGIGSSRGFPYGLPGTPRLARWAGSRRIPHSRAQRWRCRWRKRRRRQLAEQLAEAMERQEQERRAETSYLKIAGLGEPVGSDPLAGGGRAGASAATRGRRNELAQLRKAVEGLAKRLASLDSPGRSRKQGSQRTRRSQA
jgi:hypothetical protein